MGRVVRPQRSSVSCWAAVAAAAMVLLARGVTSERETGKQIPKPEGGLASLEQALGRIGTGPSSDTLQAIKDSQIMTPEAVGAVLRALGQAGASKAGASAALQPWQVNALEPHAHYLVAYLKVRGSSNALELLRRMLRASPGQSELLKSRDLQLFAKAFDAQDFLRWVTARPTASPANNKAAPLSSTTRRTMKTAAPQHSPKFAQSPQSPESPPSHASPAGHHKPSLAPEASPAAEPRPIGNDPNDPLDQLYEWSRRVKALGGAVTYLSEGLVRRRSRSLLRLDDDSDQEVDVTAATARAGKGAPALGARRQLRGTPEATDSVDPNLNVGFDWFKPRRIGVVFHMYQFRDNHTFLYPPQVYWSGDEPARRLLETVNKVYKYSGVNIQFYLKDYRTNVGMYPYLEAGDVTLWQMCGQMKVYCTCKMTENNYKAEKYLNVHVLGSVGAYRGYNLTTVAMGMSSASAGRGDLCSSTPPDNATGVPPWDPKSTPKSQHVWLSFDMVDPLQQNSAAVRNSGGTILAHEFAHVLGLYHTFPGADDDASAAKACEDSDDVADTPPDRNDIGWTRNATLVSELTAICKDMSIRGILPTRKQLAKFDTCLSNHYVDNLFNVMNYVPASCRVMFTRGQVRELQRRVEKYQLQLGD